MLAGMDVHAGTCERTEMMLGSTGIVQRTEEFTSATNAFVLQQAARGGGGTNTLGVLRDDLWPALPPCEARRHAVPLPP